MKCLVPVSAIVAYCQHKTLTEVSNLSPPATSDGMAPIKDYVDEWSRPGEGGPNHICFLEAGYPVPAAPIKERVLITSLKTRVPPVSRDTTVIRVDDDLVRLTVHAIINEFFGDAVAHPDIDCEHEAKIHPSAVIGAEGQNYRLVNGHLLAGIPHVGGVYIGAWANVGPCATIQRAVIGTTWIGSFSAIGPGANVGHGAYIGEHTLVAARATIAGSAVVGDRVTIWQGAMVANGVKIGDDAVIGMGAVVLRDVPHGTTWVGNPARQVPQTAPGI